jgi:hypothetical protein
MVDVVLRKTGSKDWRREYALMIRDFRSGIEVEWTTLCYMDGFSADSIAGEEIHFWGRDQNAEETDEVRALRLEHPALREAWETYQVLKRLCTNKNK